MTLMEQCQIWNDNDEYQKIVDAIEVLPEEERTPELCSELARAYNNLADPGTAEGRAQLRRALDLLRPYEETLKDDHCWNFRMAYAYYYLDQEGPALPYFERALEKRPATKIRSILLMRAAAAWPCPGSSGISVNGRRRHGRRLFRARRNCAA